MISVKRWMWSGQEKVNLEIQVPTTEDERANGPLAVYFLNEVAISGDVFMDIVSMLAVPK